MTCDLLFPVLEKVEDRSTARAIMNELFGSCYWAGSSEGPGGIRTVNSAEPCRNHRADLARWDLVGGLWPNITLLASKVAAFCGLPGLALQGLRSTYLVREHSNPLACNVVPGEFPEYFNADDLIQRGMPLIPLFQASLTWAAAEGLAGIALQADSLAVNPILPKGWDGIGWQCGKCLSGDVQSPSGRPPKNGVFTR